jgi:hypothetical protein
MLWWISGGGLLAAAHPKAHVTLPIRFPRQEKNQESLMQPIRLGLVGYGKIARDQHVPAINANPAFQLVSVATQGQPCDGVANFQSLSELLENGPSVDAIAFCTPPQGRFVLVQQALAAGKHVLVEKPRLASAQKRRGGRKERCCVPGFCRPPCNNCRAGESQLVTNSSGPR